MSLKPNQTGQIGEIERATQNRVVQLFIEKLGYEYLGNWEKRPKNSNIEESLLSKYLLEKGYSQALANKAILELKNVAGNVQDNL